MVNSYKTGLTTHWRKLALMGLLGLATTAVRAQTLNYATTTATNTTSTYTDLGTTGTAIATSSTDDANSAAQNIGFTFNYNGQAFTQFILNTNGFIKLGSTAPSSAALAYTPELTIGADAISSTNAADVNLLIPFNVDLQDGTAAGGAEYRVVTTGTAGSRVCTIQWKNVKDKALTAAAQYDSFSFQVKLYEGTNNVEFVYGATTAGATGADAFRIAGVGIKGSGPASGQTVLFNKTTSAGAWSTAVPITGNYAGSAFNYRRTAPADAGRTFRFAPIVRPANDAAVTIVYTLGQLAQTYSTPHAVQAVVTNNSASALTNLPVTLTVSGANSFTNTQTVASIGSGSTATVTFAAYPLTSTGTNTLTVTVPADDVATNNSATASQNVSPNRLSFIDPSQALVATGVGVGAAEGILAAKYTVTQPTTVYEVKPTFAASAGNTSTYQILLLDATGTGGTPGNILYTSPTQTRTAAAGTVTVAVPNIAVSGSFFVGIKELATNPALAYQTEDPLRTGVFYFKTATGAWTSVNTTTLRTRLALELSLGAPITCAAPTAVSVTGATTTSATVNFTAPSNGTSYTIIYGATGFNPATGGTTVTTTSSPYTITGLAAGTSYDVYIKANCGATDVSAQVGPVRFSTQCQAPIIATFPYSENFDGVSAGVLPCGYTVLNANGDTVTWRNRTTVPGATGPISIASTAPNAMTYYYNENGTSAADDWFFTPALFLRAGSSYQLSFKYRNSGANFPERLEVKYGSAATVAGQTTTIWNNANVATSTYATANATSTIPVLPITPTTSGNVYIGFHAYSLADQFFLSVDDLTITSTTTGVSKALLSAVNVYPNPSAGQFTVQVRGANAKGTMQVEVTNVLGQRVHTAAIRDNFENKLDLSALANGMYTLKVKSGNDYMIQNIVVQK